MTQNELFDYVVEQLSIVGVAIPNPRMGGYLKKKIEISLLYYQACISSSDVRSKVEGLI
jgi:hypothetical protein